MKILLTNDDGIDAEGINVLYQFLKENHEIFVIAPKKEMSGAGSSITTKRPLSPKKIKENFIAVDGTPVDCVHLGLHELCPFRPDLLISGINYGANMAEDLVYSGTVGAAMEAREFSIPSLAVSAAAFRQPGSKNKQNPNFFSAAKITLDIIVRLEKLNTDTKIIFNLNVPNLEYEKIKKIELTSLGSWGARNPPQRDKELGTEKFWVSHRTKTPTNKQSTDIAALSRGLASLTPISPKFLSNEYFKEINAWLSAFK